MSDDDFETRDRERSDLKSTLSGLVIDPREQDEAAAVVVVTDLFDNYPWDAVKKAFEERDFSIVSTDSIELRVETIRNLRTEIGRIDCPATQVLKEIITLTDAASLIIFGIQAEEGDPEGVRSLIGEIRSRAMTVQADLEQFRKNRWKEKS